MHFPFGQPVVALRQPPLSDAAVFVLGVYPSAVHARWLYPDGGVRVVALAVASEPELFWRGENAAEIISAISVPAGAGRLEPAGLGLNGSYGLALDKHYLAPLGLTRRLAWLCHLLPESRLHSGQAAAIEERYASVACAHRLPAATVPPMPSRYASDERVEEIAAEFIASGATTLLTLGDAPLKEFVARLGLHRNTSLAAFGKTPGDYGKRHSVTLRGKRFELLPLVHLREAAQLGDYSRAWAQCHFAWVGQVSG